MSNPRLDHASWQLVLPSTRDLAAGPAFRSGREVVGVTEALYLRLFIVALGGLEIVCAFAIVAALVRTQNANIVRTTALALVMALLVALTLRSPGRSYRAMRRRPWLSLGAPMAALAALAADGVGHSPLSYVAAVSIAIPAFVCGRRWALAGAVLITSGAIATAALRMGVSALNSVGQGVLGYFAWALILAGLAESFVQLTIRMPQSVTPRATFEPPIRVPNLAGEPTSPRYEEARPATRDKPIPEPAPRAHRLTARQMQVVALLADGLQAGDIAQRLGIATATVYRHVEQAKARTRLATRTELVALAVRDGLLPPQT